MLRLENLVWSVPDGERIIDGITYTAEAGKLIVVTGPNGGGKTTIAKLIAGLEKPDEGRIILNGEEITDLDITARAKKGIAYAFQQPVRFKGITVRDLLDLAGGAALTEEEHCELLGRVGLCAKEYIGRELNAGLSGGEMKRIEIASVLARRAPLSIFDEPEAGIDLWSFSRLVETFRRLRAEEKGTLLIISHQERILEIADEIVVVADGKIRACGAGKEILPSLLKNEIARFCSRGKENA
ncbi:MAG: ATP-binding cassette domain-containing protein [Bacteroides sp.]|nr:ATP-binding cassette domain-containing protein [Eubacterium sp.]MCM1417703.1 ATP-binding cassette domain-containing protein [Roseburia sp.]MCM1461831.1 ATP-binding cassette domain-containing protein [Bacteroides sp.]